MKLSQNKQPKFIQFKSLPPYDNETGLSMADDEDFWPMMGVLATIITIWTAEPFTIIPAFFRLIMKENYDSLNPLHWWPMVWGYRATLPEEDRITIRPIDAERIMQQHGGPLNVYIIDYGHIKFRRKKDAVIFGLKYF